MRRLLEGGAYFKKWEIIHIKFKIFIIFLFKITSMYSYDI